MPDPQPNERPKVTRMTDYQGNSNKSRQAGDQGPSQAKKVEKVVTGEVTVPKKPFWRKTKDSVIATDAKSLGGYLFWDVLIPTIKDAFVNTATRGIERAFYGERATRGRDNIIGRGGRRGINTYYPYDQPRDPIGRSRESRAIEARSSERRDTDRESYILSSRDDCIRVLDEMNEILEAQGFVTVATLKELIGYPSTHVDWKYGWTTLISVNPLQVQEGFLIDFPHPVVV